MGRSPRADPLTLPCALENGPNKIVRLKYGGNSIVVPLYTTSTYALLAEADNSNGSMAYKRPIGYKYASVMIE